MVDARVIKISLGPDGNAVGSFIHNKMLDTRIYDIMFMDRTVLWKGCFHSNELAK